MTISRRMVYLEQLFAQGLTKPDIDDTSTAANVVWSATKVSTELGLKASLNSSVSFTALTVNGRDILAELDAQANRVYAVADISGLQGALNLKLDASKVGAANGVASLDGTGKIPSAQLPAFVDDVLEYANFAALPATGETGKIYVTLDNGKTYRWGGSAYAEISAAPGSTDAVPEGATNKYYTDARVRSALLTGLADTAGALAATDSVLVAFGKVKQTLAAKADLAGSTFTGKVNFKAPDANTAGVNVGYGVHPNSGNRVNGDVWTTSLGLWFQANNATFQVVTAGTLSSYVPTSQKGAADGVASLDSGGKVPTSQLPAITATTPNALTFSTAGDGGAAGSTFNGSAAVTISYNSIGAAASGHNHNGVYQLADATLTALAAVNWTAGTQVVTLTGADTFTLKTVGTAAGNLLDKAAGDALYSPIGHTHAYIPTAEKGAANGVATLDASGLIPSGQLPSYVDDVLEYANLASFPATGVTGKIYIAADTGMSYRWSGSVYAEIKAGGGTVTWGNITGTLANQTDLTTALNGKANLSGATFTGTLTLDANVSQVTRGGSIIMRDTTGVTEYGRVLATVNGAYLRGSKINLQDVAGNNLAVIESTGKITAGRIDAWASKRVLQSWSDGDSRLMELQGRTVQDTGSAFTWNTSNEHAWSTDGVERAKINGAGLGVTGTVNATGVVSSASTMIAKGGFVAQGWGAGGEGGQICLGYGNNLAAGITGIGGNNTWNIDVLSDQTFRIFRTNNAGASLVALSIAEATGNTTVAGTLTAFELTGRNMIIDNAAGQARRLYWFSGGAYAADIGLEADNVTLKHNVDTRHQFQIQGTTKFEVNGTGAVVSGNIGATQSQYNAGDPNFILAKWTGTIPTLMQRVDSGNFYFLLSNATAGLNSTFNSLRPLRIQLDNGFLESMNGQNFAGGTTVSGALTVTGGITNTGTVTSGIVKATSAYGFTVGDDAVMGDTNVANCVGLKGQQDGNQGFIRFGASATNFGWNGSHLVFGSVFTLGTSGNMSVTGTFTAGGTISASSDERLKENIRTVEGALEKVAQMRGVNFDWIESGEASSGVIAQEHQKVAPEAVHEGENGFLTVNDAATTAYLIEAIKELKGIVEAQAVRITELEAQ